MSSSTFSPFSLAFSTPKKQHYHTYITSSSTSTNVHLQQEQGIKTPKQTHLIANTSTSTTKEGKNNLLGRREVISTAIGVSVVGSNTNIFVQPQAALAGTEGVCEFTVSPSGLAFCDKLVGIGPQASAGQLIKAHYVGKLENGKVFDSSYGRGKPLTFRIGVGEGAKEH